MYSFDNGELPSHFDNHSSEIASVHKYQTRLAFWQKYHLPTGVIKVVWGNWLKLRKGALQRRTQKIFINGFIQWHMVLISLWYAVFVTSQFDVRFMFPNQRFGEVC